MTFSLDLRTLQLVWACISFFNDYLFVCWLWISEMGRPGR